MVEAALVFPLVVAAVMIIFYISIGFYMEAAGNASLHISIREEAGRISGTMSENQNTEYYAPDDRFGRNAYSLDIHKKKSKGLIFDRVSGTNKVTERIPGFFSRTNTINNETAFYIINEMDYVRWVDLLTRAEQLPYS